MLAHKERAEKKVPEARLDIFGSGAVWVLCVPAVTLNGRKTDPFLPSTYCEMLVTVMVVRGSDGEPDSFAVASTGPVVASR